MARLVQGPVLLVVLDGWGLREEQVHNGIALAQTPHYDQAVQSYSFTQLQASGEAVGLPEGQIGNSEVGHTTIGIGTVLYQDLVRIRKDIESGEFAKRDALQQAFAHVREHDSVLHVIGMLSPGGVHSHEEHFTAVLDAAKSAGVKKVVVHPFLDGRDSPRTIGVESLRKLEALVGNLGNCVIGSVTGRYFAMDRDTNWERTNKAFDAIFEGKAEHIYETSVLPSQMIQRHYHAEVFDELMEPLVFQDADGRTQQVRDNDAIVFTNFRKDRAKQLSTRIVEQAKDRNLCFVTMTNYGSELPALVMYGPEEVKETLGGVISRAGLKQVHIAETEKFPHATYYINGGKQEPYAGEEDVLIPSRKDVRTHDQAPEMRANEICEAALSRLHGTDFLFINFANPDMVGHTANEPAIITAVETVDRQLGRLIPAVLAEHGAILLIADHGNAEVIVDPVTGEPHTAHTLNPVPCVLIHESMRPKLRNDAPGLQDVAPTILHLLGLPAPESMTGTSVIME